jgi:hypothetical protein
LHTSQRRLSADILTRINLTRINFAASHAPFPHERGPFSWAEIIHRRLNNRGEANMMHPVRTE